MNVGTVEVLLQLRDLLKSQAQATNAVLAQLQANANRAATATNKLDGSAARAAGSFDKFGRQIRTTLVHVAAAGAAYKLLGAAVDSVTKQVEFVRTFEKIENITGVTRAEVERLRASLNDLSTTTAKGPQELAEGFYFIASAGLKGAEATEVLTAAAKASAVGLGETKDIARSITAAINAYGSENLSAAKAADVLLATVREGGAEASEVASVFGRVVGIASQLGVSFGEVGASIATFTRLGVGADEAVTALRGTLMAMLTPTRGQEQALKALGTSMAELRAEVKERGLAAALVDLVRAGQGNEDAIGAIIPNVRSLAGVLANAGSQADAYLEVTRKIINSNGDLGRAFEDVSKSAAFRWDQVKAQFEQLALTLGETLLPGVQAFSSALAGIDRNQLVQLGENAAIALKGLAEIIKLLVTHLDELKMLITGLVAIKLVSALEGWVHGLGVVKVATEAAASSTAGLAASIARVAGPIAIAATAALYLRDKLLEYVRDSQRGIEQMVSQAEEAGRRLEQLRDKSSLIDLDAEKRRLAEAQKLIADYHMKLADLRAEQALVGSTGDPMGDALAGASVRDQIKATEELLQQQVLVAKQSRALINDYDTIPRQLSRIGEGLRDEVVAPIKLSNDAAEQFAQRVGEVVERLKDKQALAKAELDQARARLAGGDAELDNAKQLTLEARTQLEVTKVINSLESNKQHVSEQLRQTITAIVAETEKMKADTRDIATNIAEAAKQSRLQEAGQRAMLVIAEQRKAHEREIRGLMAEEAADFQESLDIARLWVATSENMLAAFASGGRQAARSLELQTEFFIKYGDANVAMANAMAAAEAEQEKLNYLISKVGELAKPAWEIYYDAAFKAIDATGDILGDIIVQFGTTGKVSWDSVWESMKQSAIQIIADMLKEIFKRWLANQAAMAATDYASKSGSVKNVSKGGTSAGGFNISGVQGFGGASGAEALGQYALIAWGLYVIYKGFIEDHERRFGSVTVGGTGQIESTVSNSRKYLDGAQKAALELLKSLAEWTTNLNVEVARFASVTIENSKAGFQLLSGAQVIGSFSSAEDAIDAAQAFMLRFAQFADSVPSLVQAAIRNTQELSTQAITENVEFARTLLTQNMDDVGRSISDAVELLMSQVRRSLELFSGTDLVQATDSALLHFTNSLHDLYNQLTGHKDDPREAAERQRQAYNLQRTLIIAQITLLMEEVRARIAAMQIHAQYIARTLGNPPGLGGGFGGGGPISGGGTGFGFGASGFPSGGAWKGGGAFVEPTPDLRNPTNNPQLAALLQVLDNLARALAGLPPEIGEGGVHPRGGRGGGRGAAQQGVREFIADQRYQLGQVGMSDFARQLQDINREYQEQIEAAGKDKKLRAELLTLQQQATEAARAAYQADVESRVAEATGQTNGFTEIAKRFAGLRKEVVEAGFAAAKAAQMQADLTEAEQRAVEVLGRQMLGNLLGGIAQYIDDAVLKQQFLAAQSQIEFTLKMAQYKLDFELLKAKGLLTKAEIDLVQKGIDWIAAHPPIFGPGSNNATDPTWGYQPGEHHPGATQPGIGLSARDHARELLARYQSEALDRWHRALQDLNRDFEEIRRGLGNTPEVAQAYADALARLREQFLEGLRAFYEELTTGALSGGSIRTQFGAARDRYMQLLAAVQGGDLSQADALEQAARQYLEFAGQMFDTSTLGYSNIRDQITQQLAQLLGIGSDSGGRLGGNVIGGPEWFAQGTQLQIDALTAIGSQAGEQVAATSNVASVVDIASRRQEAKLDEMITRLDVLISVAETSALSTPPASFTAG